ncbi:MAG: uracil phosphoribosyltransferase [Myxococcota bacterium]|nr:uracil phosphoribosyltransferase [Myxococcota bacterium]
MGEVHVIAHPLVQHKLTLMRRKDTPTSGFRQLLEEIGMLMGYEVTRDMPLSTETIETPLEAMEAPVLEGKKVVLVSILRAGDGILTGILKLLPSARIGHIGLYRDPKTLVAVEYYFKIPEEIEDRDVIVCDPMLATGNSAIAAVERIAAAVDRQLNEKGYILPGLGDAGDRLFGTK